MATEAKRSNKWAEQKQWGDDDYPDVDNSGDAPLATGSRFETPLDAHNIKTVIEYHKNEQEQRIKIIKKVKVVKKSVRANKKVAERRKWKKFGAAANAGPGPEENVTYVSTEKIILDLAPAKQEVKEDKGPAVPTVVCRNCGETGHWTLKCPKRLLANPGGAPSSLPPTEEYPTSPRGDNPSSSSAGKYVPPSARPGAKPSGPGGANRFGESDAFTLRVTNLSEDTTEADLAELFRPFGPTSRIYLAKDRNTNTSRGFAFINYVHKDDAQKALDKLNGYGYANLILHVEWSKPREEKK
jgi:translation initiation factor 3 subunit G